MVDTKAIGVRIPVDLYEHVLAANPGKTFTDIVKSALEEKYGFVTTDEIEETPLHNERCYDKIVSEVDEFLKQQED